MLFCSSLAALVLFTAVVSQPLFFLLALGRASLALSGGAYVELRQRINACIEKPLTALYLSALLACAMLAVVAYQQNRWPLAGAASLAALGLIVDLVLAVLCNVPMNREVNSWTASTPPEHWRSVRARWHGTFRVRQIVLGVAFFSLCAGLLAPA